MRFYANRFRLGRVPERSLSGALDQRSVVRRASVPMMSGKNDVDEAR
jgi:hypothetical protein